MVLASLAGSDVAYTMYLNASGASEHDVAHELLDDAHIFTREWIPQRYAPTSRAFQIHKPHYTNRALVYGDLYHAELQQVPEVARDVLRQRYVGNSVDAYGFRETTPLEEARIFALGDSFVFGVGVDQPKTWVEVLEREIGRPVYNLGVSGSGPRAHLLLLEYLLETYGERVSIDRLLWLVFDGNDLEDGHAVHRQQPSRQSRLLHGTIVETLAYSLPRTLKAQSLLGRLVHGDVSWRGAGVGAEHLLVDGVQLRAPLYRSEAFGPRLFFPEYVERAGRPRSYVLGHANRPALEQTFEQMAALAERHGFPVTVLTAASAARQYGPRFEGFPAVSEEPHFLDFVTELAHRSGFSTIDLYRGMQPYAREELLFWRDDTHWNERGNEVVARIIAERLEPDAGLSFGRK
jgi:lysophospholipase L1-like esterase